VTLLAQGCEDAVWRAVSVAPRPWRVAHNDQDFQASPWGAHAEALARGEARRRVVEAAVIVVARTRTA
jgi:chaperone required for assembly of F1-ATPase